MKCRLQKETALGLYFWCRQAERSLDFTLTGGAAQWTRFTEYYDDRKRGGLVSALEQLRALGVHWLKPPSNEKVARLSVWAPFLYLFRRVLNPFKRVWSFSDGELAFIYSALDTVLRTLSSMARPDQAFLIELRMRLYDCQWIIGNRMCGLRELDKATYVEHFCQAPHITAVTLEEMGISLPPLKRPAPRSTKSVT